MKKKSKENQEVVTQTNEESQEPKKENGLIKDIKKDLKKQLIIIGIRIIQAIVFLLPLGILMIIKRDTFFKTDTGVGLTGLAILGIIIYIFGLKKIFDKVPKIVYFVLFFLLTYCFEKLSGFVYQIGQEMLIGACLSLPINYIIRVLNVNADTTLNERSKIRARKEIAEEEGINLNPFGH